MSVKLKPTLIYLEVIYFQIFSALVIVFCDMKLLWSWNVAINKSWTTLQELYELIIFLQ